MIVIARRRGFWNGLGAFVGYMLLLWVFFPTLFWVFTVLTAVLVLAVVARHALPPAKGRHRA